MACFLQNRSIDGIKPVNNKGVELLRKAPWIIGLAATAAIAFTPRDTFAQNTTSIAGTTVEVSNDKPAGDNENNEVVVPLYDFRDKPYAYSGLACANATSDKNNANTQHKWIGILVRTDNPAVYASILKTVEDLHREGHTNVAIIRGNTDEGKTDMDFDYESGDNYVGIYWGGREQYYLTNVGLYNGTENLIRESVIERNTELGLVNTTPQTYDNVVLQR